MQSSSGSNSRSGSTRWEWRLVKITPAPHGNSESRPQAARWHHLPWRNPRQWQTIRVRYTGGAEAWWEIEARGSRGATPGVICLHDVMAEICQWNRKPPNS